MGRHSAPDDESDDDLGVEDLQRVQELVAAGSVTETGRHYLPEIAGLELAPDAEPAPEFSSPYLARRRLAPVNGAHTATSTLDSLAIDPVPPVEVGPPAGAPEWAPERAPVKTSRAGRNLPAAIGVGLAMGGVVIASLLVYRASFVWIICLAVVVGVNEMVRAIGTVEARPPLIPLVVGALAMDISAWFQGPNGLVVGFLLTLLGLAIWRLGDGVVGYQRDVASAALIIVYVPLLAGFAVLLTHYDDGAGRVIAFIATVVCSDVGGYTAGVLIGRHPMAPTVSPKKSWEGFAGSALACSLAGGLLMTFTFHGTWWSGVLFGLAIAATATLGDLGESMIKRDLGIKDMGSLLPGHGGLMDRLDSLLPCAVVAYLIFAAAVPT